MLSPTPLLALRLFSLLATQVLIAATIAITGGREPWWSSVAWWPWSLSLANLLGLGLVWAARRRHGLTIANLYLPTGWRTAARPALMGGPFLVVLAIVPAAALAQVLWPDPGVGRWLLRGAEPPLHLILGLLIAPATSALLELPLLRWWLAHSERKGFAEIAVATLFFSAQHALHPFAPALSFFLWRSLMSLPIAFLFAFSLARRPGLLPYWLVTHALLMALAGAWVLLA
jgi:hypothetical protein